MRPVGNDTGRVLVSLLVNAMEVFFMGDVFLDQPDEHQSAFVDPWSHQQQHWGDIPDHAVFAGAWHLDVGIDTIHEALFLARDDDGDRLWSLTTPTENATRESLSARERGDRDWIKRKITYGCVAGAARRGTPREAASTLLGRLFRSRTHFAYSRPPYVSGLLTSQEIASIIEAIAEELRSNREMAEASRHNHEAAIIKAARDLKLNPRPAGHVSTAWIAGCARRSHFIMISPSRNEFGCGYCKRAGGPAELEAVCEEVVRDRILGDMKRS
jgi:hypothetical protein